MDAQKIGKKDNMRKGSNETSEKQHYALCRRWSKTNKCESERLWHVERVRKEVKSVKLKLRDYGSGVVWSRI